MESVYNPVPRRRGCGCSATVTSSAGAFTEEPPEVGRCLELTGGRFKEGNCKTAAKMSRNRSMNGIRRLGRTAKAKKRRSNRRSGSTKRFKELTAIKLETVHAEGVTCKSRRAKANTRGRKRIGLITSSSQAANRPAGVISTNPKATNNGEILVKELDGEIGIEKVGLKEGKEDPALDKIANVVPAGRG